MSFASILPPNRSLQSNCPKCWSTFAFAIVPVTLEKFGVRGTVVSAAGKPLATAEVILVENQIKYRTFTNAKGEFVFVGRMSGPATVQAAGCHTTGGPSAPLNKRL